MRNDAPACACNDEGSVSLFQPQSLGSRFRPAGKHIRQFRIRFGGCEKSLSDGYEGQQATRRRNFRQSPLLEQLEDDITMQEAEFGDDSSDESDDPDAPEVTYHHGETGQLVGASVRSRRQ